MKKHFSLLFVLLVVCFLAHAQEAKPFRNLDDELEAGGRRYIGMDYPDFVLTTLDSQRVSKASLKGKVVFINFWFERCGPCQAETEALNDLYRKMEFAPDFVFLSITPDPPQQVRAYQQKKDIRYPVVSMRNVALGNVLRQRNGYPTSVVLDRNGKVAYWVSGGHPYKDMAHRFVFTRIFPKIMEALGQEPAKK